MTTLRLGGPASNRRKKIRLLVVDDHDEFCNSLKECVELCRHQFEIECEFVDSASRAAQLLHEWAPSVVLVDTHLSSAEGLRVIEGCRELSIPVVATSTSTDPLMEESVMSHGAIGHVIKSEDPEEIEHLLTVLADVAEDTLVVH